jgi:hypothetical protein
MAKHYTADEAKNDYISEMGEDLGRIFHALWQETFWLHNEWNEYLQLFGTNPARIKLLNDAAPRFFRMVQDDLVEMIALRIARLTDPSKSAGKSKLTIQQLPPLINDQILSQELSGLIRAAITAAEPCRTRRHRRIAHSALDLSLHVATDSLPDLTRANIAAAISSLGHVLNAVSFHYINSRTEFSLTSNPGGTLALIRILDYGLIKKKERMATLERGELARDENL